MIEYEVKGTEENECGICMIKMKKAVKLYCGHYYHSECILKMLINNKKCCPVCKSSFDHYNGASSLENGQNVIGSIMRGVINPLLPRRNRVSEEDIEYVVRLFPNIPQWEIEAEIQSIGNIEQAIVNISEWT